MAAGSGGAELGEFVADHGESRVVGVLAVGRRAFALADDLLDRLHGSVDAVDREQARQREFALPELSLTVAGEQGLLSELVGQFPDGPGDAVVEVALRAVLARRRRQ